LWPCLDDFNNIGRRARAYGDRLGHVISG
jgi:hypothetical protein